MSWYNIERQILQRSCHEDISVYKWGMIHPEDAGFYRSTGAPQGQISDYRKLLKNGRSLHVREYEDNYRVHWDYFDPLENIVGHFLLDAPFWGFLALLGIGILADYLNES